METTEIEIYLNSYQFYFSMWKNQEIADREYFARIIEIAYNMFKINEPILASGILCDISADYLTDQFIVDCLSDPVFSNKSDFVYKELVKHGYIKGGPVTNMSPAMA